jgi:hypothetical protein
MTKTRGDQFQPSARLLISIRELQADPRPMLKRRNSFILRNAKNAPRPVFGYVAVTPTDMARNTSIGERKQNPAARHFCEIRMSSASAP